MTKIRKKKPGRPVGYRVENPVNKTLPKIRVTDDQLENYKAAAKKSGKTFSAWVRNALDRIADKETK